MAEPYSDKELATVLRLLDENGATQNAATIRRLQRERDKARHVAKVLAGPAKHLKVLGHDLMPDELKAIHAAMAYPGREP
jgi:hypothetical protein